MSKLLASLFLLTALTGCSPGGGACVYDGKSYASGASFPSTDGCNTCSCGVQGEVACTLRACVTPDGGGADGGGADGGDVVQCSGAAPSFPSFNKSCAVAADCIVAVHQINCCGSQRALGVNLAEKARFDADEKVCRAQYPRCGCPTLPTVADDGKSSQRGDGSDIGVGCSAGACATFIK